MTMQTKVNKESSTVGSIGNLVSSSSDSIIANDSGISVSSYEEGSECSLKSEVTSEKSSPQVTLSTGEENPPKIQQKRKSSISSIITEKRIKRTDSSASEKKLPRKNGKERKQYVCIICKKEFLGSSDLRKHLLIHADEKPFECEHCKKKFRQAVCLKNHIASIHSTEKKFTCDECKKAFPIKERLRLHMRVHSGEKPYNCPVCEKKFARGGQLRQHLVIHDGQKKYPCEKCPSSFSSLGNLRIHDKTHLEDGEELSCHICNKIFYQTDLLRKHLTSFHLNSGRFNCKVCKKTLKGHFTQHMKIHKNVKPHICDVCGSQFSQKSQLNVHQRMHSGERPYQCRVCWQAFAHSSVLKLHIRKHTGEKPFNCPLCKENGVAFSQLAHLKTHMRTIHNKDKPYLCEICENFFKTKSELILHSENCSERCADSTESIKQPNDTNTTTTTVLNTEDNSENTILSNLRLLIAVILKKISSEDRLKQLGFEKRLIDNVIVTALKLAGRTAYEDSSMNTLDRLRKNIEEFLEWTIPEPFKNTFKKDNKTVDELLEKLATAYSKAGVSEES